MRKQSWLAVVIAAALCLAFAAPAAAGDPIRPFRGWDSGLDLAPGVPPAECVGAVILYRGQGTGEFLHLGRAHVEVSHCTYVDLATGAGWFDNGTLTITAANGDTLVMAEHGTFQLSPAPDGSMNSTINSLDWTVIGGTGRFMHATGSGGAHGFSVNATTPASTTTVWLSGTISY